MRTIVALGKRFLVDDSGPTATEYAVLIGFIVFSIYGAILVYGGSVSGRWENNTNRLSSAIDDALGN